MMGSPFSETAMNFLSVGKCHEVSQKPKQTWPTAAPTAPATLAANNRKRSQPHDNKGHRGER